MLNLLQHHHESPKTQVQVLPLHESSRVQVCRALVSSFVEEVGPVLDGDKKSRVISKRCHRENRQGLLLPNAALSWAQPGVSPWS